MSHFLAIWALFDRGRQILEKRAKMALFFEEIFANAKIALVGYILVPQKFLEFSRYSKLLLQGILGIFENFSKI